MTRRLLDSALAKRFEMVHLDTTDRRGVANIGRLDAANVWLAGVHGARFAALLTRGHVDTVYLPVSKNSLGFLRDALFLGPAAARHIPLIVHFHGAGYDDFVRSAPAPVRALVRLLLQRATRAIVPGHTMKPMLRGLIADERIAVVPNGVADPLGGLVPARVHSGTMHILFLGNLLPGKGYVELIDAVQTLLGEGVDVAVTFAGSVVDAVVHERALATIRYGADRIRFAGAVGAEAKAVLLRDADVLALPSEDEAHPLVILEAMAAGLPVVSTRRGAIPETVVDGETGVLIETRDAAALTLALRRLADQPGLLATFGAAGRARYLAHYTIERWADRMSNVFESGTGVNAS
jgi:glycosyltransferase involved in cell wall biosynthesis